MIGNSKATSKNTQKKSHKKITVTVHLLKIILNFKNGSVLILTTIIPMQNIPLRLMRKHLQSA